jgi:CRISPR-associated endoribonuclease Cas6
MVSSFFLCKATNAGHVPLSNGYLLFSALFARLGDSFNNDGFFTLSSLMPDYFWTTFRCAPKNGDIVFEKGALFSFRVSFLDDDVFENFSSHVTGTRLTLGGAAFQVLSASLGGGAETSRRMGIEELSLIPSCSGVSVHFLLPTGFKSNDRQNIFPAPELFFGSLALRWRKWTKTEDVFDKAPFSLVLVDSYSLSSFAVRLKNNQVFRGCVGNVRYSFSGLPDADRAFLSRLSSLAPFCGVGYKVTQGMGLVKVQLLV